MQMCCNMGGVSVPFSHLRPLGGGTVGTQTRQGHVGGVQFEVVGSSDPPRHLAEDIGGQVLNSATGATLRVQVRPLAASEVIGRGAMTQVDVLDHPQLAECHQRAIHARAVHFRCDLGDGRDNFFHGEVSSRASERRQHRPPRRGHPLTFGPEAGRHRSQERLSVVAGQWPRIHVHTAQPSCVPTGEARGSHPRADHTTATPEGDSLKPGRCWRAALMAGGVRGDGRWPGGTGPPRPAAFERLIAQRATAPDAPCPYQFDLEPRWRLVGPVRFTIRASATHG
jgi:hypothetical protein